MTRIAVVGAGIVGVPMAALLAEAARQGAYGPGAQVVLVQRDSPTSGWKVPTLNAGRSPIGGVEPGLDELVARNVAAGTLAGSHDPASVAGCEAIFVAVQTDKAAAGGPDYGPLYGALDSIAGILAEGPRGGPTPLVCLESTLAPSSMATVVRARFEAVGLGPGRDVLLANSPNRVMPGRLVERVRGADKLAGALSPAALERVGALYDAVVTEGTVHRTNSLTAEIVKTLENTWRDVRVALAHEVGRWCDERGVDLFALRERVNGRLSRTDGASYDPAAVPTGAMLVPGLGVGGHCLPKDGVLLRWRLDEADPRRAAGSLVHAARRINDAAPTVALARAEAAFGALDGRRVVLLGGAYRADSDDARNSPTFALAHALLERGCELRLHDPFLRATDNHVRRAGLAAQLVGGELGAALSGAEVAFVCQAHAPYRAEGPAALAKAGVRAVYDAANAWSAAQATDAGLAYAGVGRGEAAPDEALVRAVTAAHRALDVGFANELREICDLLDGAYARDDFQRVDWETVRRLAATCATGCDIAAPGAVPTNGALPDGTVPVLVRLARATSA